MFFYVPCQDIFKVGDECPYTDRDVIVIQDGKFKIGEIKSNAAGFNGNGFTKLEDVAKEIQPDEIIIAAAGEDWPPEVQVEIDQRRSTLDPFAVEIKQFSLAWK